MRALDHKLLRDLGQLRGQITAIALVIACGVATFVMFLSALDALEMTRAEPGCWTVTWYRRRWRPSPRDKANLPRFFRRAEPHGLDQPSHGLLQ